MSHQVSVVIPVFNRTEMLSRAIGSVMAQELMPLEVIVVDDGSKEDVKGAITGFEGELRYHRHTENRGANVARNTGADLATGDYIAFLDSDDEWMPGKLSAQISAMEANKAPIC